MKRHSETSNNSHSQLKLARQNSSTKLTAEIQNNYCNFFGSSNLPTLGSFIQKLKDTFPDDKSYPSIKMDLFSARWELGCYSNIRVLPTINEEKSANKKAAIISKNVNFLSMLPELAKTTDILILVEHIPLYRMFMLHLFSSLKKSKDIADFFTHYNKINPMNNKKNPLALKNGDKENYPEFFETAWLEETLVVISQCAYTKGFLSNPNRFLECKEAAEKITLVDIQFNLFDKECCEKFGKLLKIHELDPVFCDLSNLHEYDTEEQLRQTLPLFLTENSWLHYTYTPQFSERNHLSSALSFLSTYFKNCYKEDSQATKEDVEVPEVPEVSEASEVEVSKADEEHHYQIPPPGPITWRL